MRILLELRATKNFKYDIKYFHKLQGLIYNLVKETEYFRLHDKKGYKFFCFSNIYPIPKDYQIRNTDKKYLLISSPDKFFIRIIEDKLKKINTTIHIGKMEFKIINMKKIKVKFKRNIVIFSATPIIIKIPEKDYEKYNIPKNFRKKKYVYWRPQYNFEAFVKQLERNLIKKYNEFYKKKINLHSIFEVLRFRKGPIINHVVIDGKEQIFVGSTWEFSFSYLTKEQRKILEFGIDCGFGERNSYGFGFMNIV